ncbi:MAG: DUF2992 family protein [Clostridia bacterium]|nr:DUF2992 family protein [Clostridia bacterium]
MGNTSKLTVLFEAPFWVGLFEREADGLYEVCKITFGAEPKDFEVYDFLLKNFSGLKFSPFVDAAENEPVRVNPKRMQRLIEKHLHAPGIGTKAQQALKLQREQDKSERNAQSREKSDAEKQRRFELRQQKRKEKHAGH